MINQKVDINQIINNQKLRKELAISSFYWFFHIYLYDYVKFKTADFQKDIIGIAEDQSLKNAFIVAFRGSAKSTLVTFALPLWSIIGKHKKKFIVIISQTQAQAKLILSNIRRELETNQLFIKDFGHLSADPANNEWNSFSIVLGKSGIRISVYSTGDSIRGIRHLSNRPDLIACDDLEDLASVKNKEIRNQTFDWFTGEVMPLGDRQTKLIVIGNLLHEDSLMMKIKNGIMNHSLSGKFFEYPLISPDNQIAWPGKYPSQQEIDEERKKTGNDIAWSREYLLQILPPEDRIIKNDWIRYYDTLPSNIAACFAGNIISIDPAISQKHTADNTAIIVGAIYKSKDFHCLYITDIYNQKIGYPETRDLIKHLSDTVNPSYKTKILVEQVAYQASLIQDLQKAGYPAIGIKPHGSDKRARLNIASSYVKNGNIFFPRSISADLVGQLVNFGVERYDDLVDAFTVMVIEAFATPNSQISNQGPITMHITSPSVYDNMVGKDWADVEDEQIFKKIRRSNGGWNRILG
ncbi:MAG: phage terminase large subunit [Patescibacteria group bacterium]|jgi:predicted phage terminase large subunit-like protein